jgi:hypothetical protein
MSGLVRRILVRGLIIAGLGVLGVESAKWALYPPGLDIENPIEFRTMTAKKGNSYKKIADEIISECWPTTSAFNSNELAVYISMINERPSLRNNFLDIFNYDFWMGKNEQKSIGEKLRTPVYCRW